MKANLFRLVGFAALMLVMQLVVEHYPKAFMNINWFVIAGAQAVLYVVFGAIAFRLYVGNGWTRTAFTVAIPAVTNLAQELIIGSDPAYPFLLVALIVPYAIAFAVGAGLMALTNRGSRDNRSHVEERSV